MRITKNTDWHTQLCSFSGILMKWQEMRRSENVEVSCLGAIMPNDETATRCIDEVNALRREFFMKNAGSPHPFQKSDKVFDAFMESVILDGDGSVSGSGHGGSGSSGVQMRLSDDRGSKMNSNGDWQLRLENLKEALAMELEINKHPRGAGRDGK
jgi:hypothetical protein